MNSTFPKLFATRDSYATQAVLILSLLMGIIIMVKCIDYRSKVSTTTCNPLFVGRVHIALMVMMFFALVLIILPVTYFAAKLTSSTGSLQKTFTMYESIVKVQYVICAVAVVLLILSFYIMSFQCDVTGLSMIWATPAILLVGAVVSTVLRIYYERQELLFASTVFGRAKSLAGTITDGVYTMGDAFGSTVGTIGSAVGTAAGTIGSAAGSAAGAIGGYLGFGSPSPSPTPSPYMRDSMVGGARAEKYKFDDMQYPLPRNPGMDRRRGPGLSTQPAPERFMDMDNRRTRGLSI